VIFATVGTHTQGFDRLVAAVDGLAAKSSEKCIIQIGSSVLTPKHADWFRYDTPARIDRLISDASVVVAHAGAGTLMAVLSRDKPLVAMPRDVRYREVVDDHQFELCQALESLGMLAVAHEGNLAVAIKHARMLPRTVRANDDRMALIVALRAAAGLAT
jgi:beta-1,4-N-acetylglucosaminyltransferase